MTRERNKANRHQAVGTAPSPRREGQAIVEFVVGLVAVLVLLAGLLQVASLTKTHTDTMVQARRLAAELAMVDLDTASSPDYIRLWRDGQDSRSYTRDDQHSDADPGAFRDRLAARAAARSADWDIINSISGNDFTPLHGAAAPASLFGLVQGADTRSVDLLPAFQHLIYDAPSIDVRCEVWMTRTRGLY